MDRWLPEPPGGYAGPAPAAAPPPPNPPPRPAAARWAGPSRAAVAAGLVLAALVAANGYVLYRVLDQVVPPAPGPGPGPAPSPFVPTPKSPGYAEGKAFGGQDLPRLFGRSLRQAAADVRGGAALSKAKSDHEQRWGDARAKAFDDRIRSQLDQVLPDGSGDPTPEQRARYADVLDAAGQGSAEAAAR